MLARAGAPGGERVSFVHLDVTEEAGWSAGAAATVGASESRPRDFKGLDGPEF